MELSELKNILEAVLMAAGEPLPVPKLVEVFPEGSEQPTNKDIRAALKLLTEDYSERPTRLKQLASGFCFQVSADYGPWLAKLWQERPPRYSKALMETLAIIVYKQPLTRAEIEDIRGVAVSTTIIKTLVEREWVHVVGHRDVPGKPAVYATTKAFLDYFNVKSLTELPPLPDIQDLEEIANKFNESLQQEIAAVVMEEKAAKEAAIEVAAEILKAEEAGEVTEAEGVTEALQDEQEEAVVEGEVVAEELQDEQEEAVAEEELVAEELQDEQEEAVVEEEVEESV